MGSSRLAIEEITSPPVELSLRVIEILSIDMGRIIAVVTFLFAFLLINKTGAFVLLDPATGREIETNFPGTRFKIMEPSPAVNQNGIMSLLSPGARRRSEYVSPSGTPLFKLRQRNPFGFGG